MTNNPQTTSLSQKDEVHLALMRIKTAVCGDRIPNWKDDWATTVTRGFIADLCDAALSQMEKINEA